MKIYGVFVLSVETKTYILAAVLSTTFPLRTCWPSCILQFAFVFLHYIVFVYFLAIVPLTASTPRTSGGLLVLSSCLLVELSNCSLRTVEPPLVVPTNDDYEDEDEDGDDVS